MFVSLVSYVSHILIFIDLCRAVAPLYACSWWKDIEETEKKKKEEEEQKKKEEEDKKAKGDW